MKRALIIAVFLTGCSIAAGPPGPPGPQGVQGPPGAMGQTAPCACAPQLLERVVSVDEAEIQSNDTELTIEKIPAADWPPGARVAALWIDPGTVKQMGLTTSQLAMNVGTADEPMLFASYVPLSNPSPSIKGHEGPGLWPSGGAILASPLVVTIMSDHLPLMGVVGHIDLHVVLAIPTSF